MKVTIDISCCYRCPFMEKHSDHPVSDEGICFYDYKCGKGDFDIKDPSVIHKNCPLKTIKKSKNHKEKK